MPAVSDSQFGGLAIATPTLLSAGNVLGGGLNSSFRTGLNSPLGELNPDPLGLVLGNTSATSAAPLGQK
jgi:hypothetical protein